MTLQEIEKIYDSIESIKSKCSLMVKIKMSLYLSKLKKYKDVISDLKKEVVTEEAISFEKERNDIIIEYKDDVVTFNEKLNELISNDPERYEKYSKTIENLETIYSYVCDDAPTITLSMEDIPDDIEDIPENIMETIFSLIDDSTDI